MRKKLPPIDKVIERPPFAYELIQTLKPIATWYTYMSLSDVESLHPDVRRAMDTLAGLTNTKIPLSGE